MKLHFRSPEEYKALLSLVIMWSMLVALEGAVMGTAMFWGVFAMAVAVFENS